MVRTFYYYAQNEYENILKKIESDQQSKISFTEKALHEFNQIQRKEAIAERERRLNEQIKFSNSQNSASESPSKQTEVKPEIT